MDEEELITQMGLLLTQIRHVRRAVESIERSTSRYASFNFAQAFQLGQRYVEPPMFQNALRVYVVNINELAPGRGIGGFVEGLLGGIGRLFGGLIGGIVGGTVSSLALPVMIGFVWDIVRRVERIMGALAPLMGQSTTSAAAGGGSSTSSAPSTPEAPAASGLQQFSAALPGIIDVVNALTGLFRTAASGPGTSPGTTASGTRERGGGGMLDTLQSIYAMLGRVSRIIDGLIILVPILIGAFAMFLVRLDTIKLAIVEMLQFAMRNVFMLRGVVLATVLDTASVAARLASQIMGIAAVAVNRILTAVFAVVGQLLNTALQALRFVLDGVRRTIDALLPWAIQTVGSILTELGNSRVFGLVFHLVRILPSIMPPLVRLVRDTSLSPAEIGLLQSAARDTTALVSAAAAPPPSVPLPPFPDVSGTLLPTGPIGDLLTEVHTTGETVRRSIVAIVGAAGTALGRAGGSLSSGAIDSNLHAMLGRVRTDATALADAMQPAVDAARERPQTGFELIAQAYERWLSEGGLSALLDRINDHFRGGSERGAALLDTLPGRAVGAASRERLRETVVEIDKLTIVVEPPAAVEHESDAGDVEEGRPLITRLYDEALDLYRRGDRSVLPLLGVPA
jgi:hypothetical protein